MYADNEESGTGSLYGENSIEITSNSYREENPDVNFFFFQYYRKYDTEDFKGDEVISS